MDVKWILVGYIAVLSIMPCVLLWAFVVSPWLERRRLRITKAQQAIRRYYDSSYPPAPASTPTFAPSVLPRCEDDCCTSCCDDH